MSTRPSPRVDRLGTPKTPAIRFTRAMTFVASWFTHLLRSASLLAPCTADRLPSQRGFYIRASSGLVALPAAGYNYNSDWTPLLAGLSPARMAASLAAPTPSSKWTFTTYSCQFPGALTHVTARRIAPPPKAAFVTRLQPCRLPGRTARQLPDQSTTLWVESSSTSDPCLRGALPTGDIARRPRSTGTERVR